MRPFSKMAAVTLVSILAIGLSACNKKKNGSSGGTAAATPASSCTWNGFSWVNQSNQPCTPTATTFTCPAQGYYTNTSNQQVACTPGQQVTGFNYSGNYPYNPNPYNQTAICDQYTQQYGVQYVPVYSTQPPYQNQYICVRYDVINQYAYGTPYYNNVDYYYGYPVYNYSGNSCGSNFFIDLGFGGFNWCFGN
ncbi:MAG: hypothetical protein AB7F86_04405 [Bdellovibrionales bacterium]